MKISVALLSLVVCFCFTGARNIRSKRSKFDLSELTRGLKALERQLEQNDDATEKHVCEKEVSVEIEQNVADEAGKLLDEFYFELTKTNDVFDFNPFDRDPIPNTGKTLYHMYECMNDMASQQRGTPFLATAVNETLGLALLYNYVTVPDANKFTAFLNRLVEKTVDKYFPEQPKPEDGKDTSGADDKKRSYTDNQKVNEVVELLCKYGRQQWHPVVTDLKTFLNLGMGYMKMAIKYMHSLQVLSSMQEGKRFIINTSEGICHGASLVQDKDKFDEFLGKAKMVYDEVRDDVIKQLTAEAQRQQNSPDTSKRTFSLPEAEMKRMLALFSKK